MSDKRSPAMNFSTIFNLLTVILGLISPFLASGDWGWGLGWIYLITVLLFTFASRIIAIRLHPGFARERLTASAKEDTKDWDKRIVPFILLLPMLSVVIAGLDKRFGWSAPFAGWIHILGLGLIVFGYTVGTWALAVNAFFSSHVRIQTDRGQKVITTGPYAILRHPGYSSGALALFGIPLLLGSYWALLPMFLAFILYIVRTALEDKTLLAELPGYKEYAEKVRFRLIPGIW